MIKFVPQSLIGTSKRWKLPLIIVFITFAWLFLWYFPWQEKLHHIYWLQLGIALTVFIVPGFCIYGLLIDSPNVGFSHITFGFAISHTIFAILGVLGRFIHLSFGAISFLMMLFGLMSLFVYVVSQINKGFKFKLNREEITYFISILPALIISLLACLIVAQRVLRDDDLTYLAYLTNLQYSSSLEFNYPILDVSQPAPLRFWLMSAPIAQALLAELSKVPGILILGGYYDPFLVVISVLCWYELAITLNLSPKKAGASTILQLLFLLLLSEYLHPGSTFFLQLNNDKATAAFILTPIFLQSLIMLCKNLAWKYLLLSLITGLSLTFMHPVILAYSVFIGGMLIILNNNCQGMQKKVMPMTILIIILIPYLIIRFSDFSTTGPISFEAEVVLSKDGSDNLITRWGDTKFYGFNLNILSMKFPYEAEIPLPESIIKWGWLLIPILAVVFAMQQRENSVAQFILSCFLLCFLAGFPFTGWVIGYFVNGRMLARSVWLFPYGLSSIYLFIAIRDYIKDKLSIQKYKANISISTNWLFFMVTVLAATLFSLYIIENELLDMGKFSAKIQRYQGLAVAGEELDWRISDHARVIGSEQLNDLLPGVSAKSKPITFRTLNFGHMPYFSKTQIEERISDTKRIFSKSLSPEDKMLLLEKYDIHFLFLQSFDLRLFEEFITSYPDRVDVTEIGGVVLLQINE